MQATHVAACNRLHEVDERLARWLLMSQDRLGGDIVPLTQEFLAHMLGTRRASVTVAAGILQKAGFDYLQSRQRPDRRPPWPGRCLPANVMPPSDNNRKSGKRNLAVSVRYRADSARTPP